MVTDKQSCFHIYNISIEGCIRNLYIDETTIVEYLDELNTLRHTENVDALNAKKKFCLPFAPLTISKGMIVSF